LPYTILGDRGDVDFFGGKLDEASYTVTATTDGVSQSVDFDLIACPLPRARSERSFFKRSGVPTQRAALDHEHRPAQPVGPISPQRDTGQCSDVRTSVSLDAFCHALR